MQTKVIQEQRWKPEADDRPWKYIVLHHSATKSGSVEGIDQVHRQRKDASGKNWLGIGYHFVIGNGDGMKDGEVKPTFRWRRQLHGAHAGASLYNQFGIGICLIGNFETHEPTSRQVQTLKNLLDELSDRYKIDKKHIIGHGDIKSTQCPGKYFPLVSDDDHSQSYRGENMP